MEIKGFITKKWDLLFVLLALVSTYLISNPSVTKFLYIYLGSHLLIRSFFVGDLPLRFFLLTLFMSGLIALFIPDDVLSERFRLNGIILSGIVMGITTLFSKKINKEKA